MDMNKISLVFILTVFAGVSFEAGGEELCPKEERWTTGEAEGYVETSEEVPGAGALKVFYRVLRVGDGAKNSAVFVLIPGGPGMAVRNYDFSRWTAYIPESATVFAVEPRGVGCSRPKGLVAFPGSLLGIGKDAADIEAVRSYLFGDDRRVFVWGRGYGGLVALKYSLNFAEKTERIIVESPVSAEGYLEGDKFAKELLGEFFKENPELKQKYEAKRRSIKEPEKELKLTRLDEYLYEAIMNGGGSAEISALFDESFEVELGAPLILQGDEKYQVDVYLQIFCKEVYPEKALVSGKRGLFGFSELCRPYRKTFTERFSLIDGLTRASRRVLLLSGARNINFPPFYMKKMGEEISRYRVFPVIAPKAGSNVLSDNPECAASVVKAFLDGAGWDDIERITEGANCK